MGAISDPLDVNEVYDVSDKDRGKGGGKKRSKSRKREAANRNLVVTDTVLACIIKWSFNFFFAFQLLAYVGLVFVFFRTCEAWWELNLCITLTFPPVFGTLYGLPPLRNFCIQSYAMAPAESVREVPETMSSLKN
ncbi:hypothetical protein EJB05_18621 [Eragrostis curvula]|uniref:Uncharacterized protein n=1 Tax=Eragrostis curvula TaxID=38414 RepID=A0A5J9VM58_9POAL|nr:hypothetical protein EJB05_18621 [Eragrostis curvula]